MFPRIGLALALIAGLSATPSPASRAAAEDHRWLVVSGRVVDHEGWPIERAKITARGSRSGSAASDASGRFQLELALGPASILAHGALEITIEARAGSARLVLPDGTNALRLSIRMLGEPGDEARAEVRASQADVAAEVARAYAASGEARATLVLAFARPADGGGAGQPAGLVAREEVALVGLRVPGTRKIVTERAKPDSAAAVAREREATAKASRDREASEKAAREKAAAQRELTEKAARERQAIEKASREKAARDQVIAERGAKEKTAREQSVREAAARSSAPVRAPVTQQPVVRTAPQASHAIAKPAPPPLASAPVERATPVPCGCRLEGTIEVQSDRPLSRRLPLIVRLRDQPACRDTVELFMGSPRVFELIGATCGTHVIDVEIPERERFRLANPASERTVTCVHGALRQVRLILLPR